jgi:hypothetical protein
MPYSYLRGAVAFGLGVDDRRSGPTELDSAPAEPISRELLFRFAIRLGDALTGKTAARPLGTTGGKSYGQFLD